MEELALSCYGVEVRLTDAAGLGPRHRVRDTLPPEFATPNAPASAAVAYTVTRRPLFRGRRSARATALPGTGMEVLNRIDTTGGRSLPLAPE